MAYSLEAIFEDQEMDEFLQALSERCGKMKSGSKELLGIAGAVAFRDINTHFKDEQGPSGQWPAWSSAYAEHMARIGKAGNGLLKNTGKLRNAFAPATSQPDGALLFVNTMPYSAAHDEGIKPQPQRKYMWLSEAAFEEIGSQFLRWMEGG